MSDDTKAGLAEFIGTFTLVFIGAGAGALAGRDGGVGLLGVAIAHGVALMVIAYTWGGVSGAHVNPAITFGIALTGRISWGKAITYWLAQCAGAIVAAYALQFLIGSEGGLGSTLGEFSKEASKTYSPLKTILVEAILTFFLAVSVFASGVGGKNGHAAGIAIGFVLMMDIICGGFLTGASMNPARTLGPALAMGELKYVWMYIVGPAIGAGAGAWLYNTFFLSPEPAPANEKKRK